MTVEGDAVLSRAVGVLLELVTVQLPATLIWKPPGTNQDEAFAVAASVTLPFTSRLPPKVNVPPALPEVTLRLPPIFNAADVKKSPVLVAVNDKFPVTLLVPANIVILPVPVLLAVRFPATVTAPANDFANVVVETVRFP
jgi:hypothetical protein